MIEMTSHRGKMSLWGSALERGTEVQEDRREGVDRVAEALGVIQCGKGHHGRDLQQADLQSVGRSDFHTAECKQVSEWQRCKVSYLREMFPAMEKLMAETSSAVLGRRAKRVKPKNFSSMPNPPTATSTTSTRTSALD